MKKTLLIFLLILIFLVVFLIFYKINNNFQKQNQSISPQKENAPTTTKESDISYIQIIVDDQIGFSLLDPQNISVGDVSFEQPLVNPQTGEKSGSSLSKLLLEKPHEGKYTLLLTPGNKKYSCTIYLYDKNGNVKIEDCSGGKDAKYTIYFDKTNSQLSSIKRFTSFSDTK